MPEIHLCEVCQARTLKCRRHFVHCVENILHVAKSQFIGPDLKIFMLSKLLSKPYRDFGCLEIALQIVLQHRQIHPFLRILVAFFVFKN